MGLWVNLTVGQTLPTPTPSCPALWHLDNWRMFSYQGSLVWCRHSWNTESSAPTPPTPPKPCRSHPERG